MGSDQSAAAKQATSQNLALSNELYGIAAPALSSATGYLTTAYDQGKTLDTSAKYGAEQTMFMDKTAGMTGSFLDPQSLGQQMSGRAAGLSGIGAEQIGGAVDEMNKIRSLLAGQGMKTTGMAASAGGLETQALAGMYPGNKTGDMIQGGLGLGAAIYGGGTKGGWWGQAAGGADSGNPGGYTSPGSFGGTWQGPGGG